MKPTVLISLAVGALLVAACSSGGGNNNGDGGSGDDGGNPSNCPGISVCDVLSMSQVNMTCPEQMSTKTAPVTAHSPQVTNDQCKYSTTATNIAAGHLCYSTAAAAQAYYQGQHDQMPNPGEMRMDLTGIGDKAYVSIQPGSEVDLRAIKGNLVVEFLHLNVMAGQEAMAQTCLTSLANFLITK